VITGLCLLHRETFGRRLSHVVTRVWTRDDPAERERYIASGDWAGKAGAYAIQDVGDRLVDRYEGSFSNVVGLPLERTAALLAEAGLAPLRSLFW
jgi:septum formation protein